MPTSPPTITALFAAVSAVLLIAMSLDVVRLRRKYQVALLGLGENKHLNRAIRIQGNFTEYVPLALLLLLILELSGTSPALLIGLGTALMVGRVCHWIGLKMSSGPSPFRWVGVTLSMAVILIEAGLAVAVSLR